MILLWLGYLCFLIQTEKKNWRQPHEDRASLVCGQKNVQITLFSMVSKWILESCLKDDSVFNNSSFGSVFVSNQEDSCTKCPFLQCLFHLLHLQLLICSWITEATGPGEKLSHSSPQGHFPTPSGGNPRHSRAKEDAQSLQQVLGLPQGVLSGTFPEFNSHFSV